MLKRFVNEYAFVARVEVTDMQKSVDWYTSKLDLEVDERYLGNPRWRQLNLPGIGRVAIGLWQANDAAASGGAVATIVVTDVDAARSDLIGHGVSVGAILEVGQGVRLCYFRDPDGNQLCLRENSSAEPAPMMLGWRAK
jgi:glyoxylase I family protein